MIKDSLNTWMNIPDIKGAEIEVNLNQYLKTKVDSGELTQDQRYLLEYSIKPNGKLIQHAKHPLDLITEFQRNNLQLK